ncbi:MAG: hypothetical protein JO290_11920 [Sphingomonadaceae bacterium]|nr:hypothetical protein [Sphingomonadaceae bacterium]
MTIPAVALDDKLAILGASGSGKTVTAKGAVEALLAERRHVVVLDPTGVWHGLRTDAAGTGAGFDIPIFGGLHGDVPIGEGDGAAIARVIVDQRLSAVVDLSALRSGPAQRRFAAGLLATLRTKPRGNFHLVFDEADEFAPQTAQDGDGERLKEDMIWVAKRGRVDGFVPLWITQRPADMAKAVLSQAQTVVLHQLIIAHDRKAAEGWLKGNGEPDAVKEIMASLPSLQVGERWVYSPRLHILERGRSALPATYDSSRTPLPGEIVAEPKLLASLNLAAIKAALAPAAGDVEPAGEDGPPIPEERRVAMRERVLAPIRERDARIAALEAECEQLRAALKEADARTDAFAAGIAEMMQIAWRLNPPVLYAGIDVGVGDVEALKRDVRRAGPAQAPIIHGGIRGTLEHAAAAPAKAAKPRASKSPAEPGALNAAALKLIGLADAVAPAELTIGQAATLCGYSPDGGFFRTALKQLQGNEHVILDGNRLVRRWVGLRPKGMNRASMLASWKNALPGAAPKIIDAIEGVPGTWTVEGIAERVGYAPTGGFFRRAMKALRDAGVLVETPGGELKLANPLPGETK